ncbi:MAG TPA: hypothetical protein PLJ78_16380 [Anaerolineae bacterium]|nr:hypothetical protein [Anaerolineae bacterium]HQK15510.1 hypothetical protein [Anaerolineae bacterium]
MEPQSTLQFDSPLVKYWQTIGLLEDIEGNEFRVFVKGPRKQDVEEFLKLVKNGDFKIGITVTPLGRPDESGAFELSVPVETGGVAGEIFTWQDISVGISRWSIKTPKPYRITYEIDPPIYPPTGTSSNQFAVCFDDHDRADVYCTVGSGAVIIQLRELDRYWQDTTHVLQSVVAPGQPVDWHEPKQGVGNWAVRITGRDPVSYFTLYYEKWVMA